MTFELKHIKHETCPVCGSYIKTASFNKNFQDKYVESVTYICGCVLEYSQYVKKVLIRTQCPLAQEKLMKALNKE